MGRVSQVRSLTPNFTVVAIKIWLTGVKIAKIANFWYNFAKKGYTPLTNFVWGGSPTFAPNFCRFGLVNVGLRPQKSPKMVIFGINLPHRGISP